MGGEAFTQRIIKHKVAKKPCQIQCGRVKYQRYLLRFSLHATGCQSPPHSSISQGEVQRCSATRYSYVYISLIKKQSERTLCNLVPQPRANCWMVQDGHGHISSCSGSQQHCAPSPTLSPTDKLPHVPALPACVPPRYVHPPQRDPPKQILLYERDRDRGRGRDRAMKSNL